MFELSIAFKYLVPRWKQLSVSIITLISTLVIALVVWLIVVFFSVKDGLENSWIDKIVAITAPVRITPTARYYNSYYYLIDTLSAASNYSTKSIREKQNSTLANPYNPEVDEELPFSWPKADRNAKGELKDIVKLAFERAMSLHEFDGLKVSDYETTYANLRIRLLRKGGKHPTQAFLENAAFLGSFDADTPSMAKAMIPLKADDIHNFLQIQSVSADNIQEENPAEIHRVDPKELQMRVQAFFRNFSIIALKVPQQGWRLPKDLLPAGAFFQAVAVIKKGSAVRIIIPSAANEVEGIANRLKDQGWSSAHIVLAIDEQKHILTKIENQTFTPLALSVPVELNSGTELLSVLDITSLKSIKSIAEIKFSIHAKIQGTIIQGVIPLGSLEVQHALLNTLEDAPIAYVSSDSSRVIMPKANFSERNALGEPLILPRSFKESGVLLGDLGFLSYYSPSPSSIQEQRIPFYVAGFYDPGIIPIGGKLVLANKDLVSEIQESSNQQNESYASRGLNVRFSNLTDAQQVKAALQREFEDAGIAPYWQISTYEEYEFTKDIIQQLQSEKNLFSLISFVIIIVACSNIISMLIILVNDKKLEIGILRAMGATSGNIAAIFGISGMVMGAIGSIIGIIAALMTLNYVNELVAMISKIQGHDLFNPIFYGHTLPTDLSMEALSFVMVTTALISLLAGIVPAVKASLMKPAAILRSE